MSIPMDPEQQASQCHVPPRRRSSRQTKPPVYFEDYETILPGSKPPRTSYSVSSAPVQSSIDSTGESHSETCDPVLLEMKQLKEFVMELGQSVKRINIKVDRMCSSGSSWSSGASSQHLSHRSHLIRILSFLLL